MTESLYEDRPSLYDAIQSEWDYDRDVAFLERVLDDRGIAGRRILEVGCGTGEHTRRFVDANFDVTAVDLAGNMLAVAREKCDARFVVTGLPELAVDGEFDAVVALRGVVNHLPPDDLDASLSALAARLAPGGVLVFDNSPLPPDGNEVAYDAGTTGHGRYVRVAQMQPRADDRLNWVLVVFGPDGELVTDCVPMTPIPDDRIASKLADCGLTVETHDGFGPDDDRTVFVASR